MPTVRLARVAGTGVSPHDQALRHRPRPQSGEFPAADAAHLPGARGRRCFPTSSRSCTARCGGATASSTRAPAGLPRRWRSAASGAATPCRSMLANTPAMLECHYGVPMAGAVLNTINTRLDAADHRLPARSRRGQGADRRPRVLQGDEGGAGAGQGEAAGDRLRRSGVFRRGRAARRASNTRSSSPTAIRISPGACRTTNGTRSRSTTPRAPPAIPRAWSITTAARICSPTATCITCGMGKHPVYLWTLPMFHCNGWCFPWTISVGRRHACLPARGARQGDVRRHRRAQGDASVRRADRDVDAAQRAGRARRSRCRRGASSSTAAAPPPEAVLAAMKEAGLQRHACLRADRGLRPRRRQRMARANGTRCRRRAGGQEGAPGRALSARSKALDVLDPETMTAGAARRRDARRGDVPRQRGDEGLSEEQAATEAAFAGGWFHSGDLGVMHPDGYIQLKDRSKDIIISGGENISSIEVEDALYKHPAVQAAAVVAKPDEKWGETPCAFVELKPGRRRDRRGAHRLVPQQPRRLQGAAPRRVRRIAEDQHRQDSEIQAARQPKGSKGAAATRSERSDRRWMTRSAPNRSEL